MRGALAFDRKHLAGALEGLINAEDIKSLGHLLTDDLELSGTLDYCRQLHPPGNPQVGQRQNRHRTIADLAPLQLEDIAPCNTVRETACPVLLIHGAGDTSVPVEDARQIHAHGRDKRVWLSVIPDAGHESIEAIGMHGRLLVDFLRGKLIERRNGGEERPLQ